MYYDDDIEGLAQSAWEAYYEEYTRRFVSNPPRIGHAPRSNKLYKAFIAIAKLCSLNKLDTRGYISFCFEYINKNKLYITPNDFISDKFISAYKASLDGLADASIDSLFKQQINALAGCVTQIDKYKSEHDVLIRPNSPFYAWFRLFYSRELDKELLQYYGNLAYSELQRNRLLRDYLRKLRPASFNELEGMFGIFGD